MTDLMIPERLEFQPYVGPTPYHGMSRGDLEARMGAVDAENRQLKLHMAAMKGHYKRKFRRLRRKQEGSDG